MNESGEAFRRIGVSRVVSLQGAMRMKTIWLAGEDRTAVLLPRLDRAAASRDPAIAARAALERTIPALREAPDEAAELDRWLVLLKAYGKVSTDDFPIPARPGFAGGLMTRLKKALWRLLRYQHERTAAQQNAVNIQLILALEAVCDEYRRECRALTERVAALEARLSPPDREARP